MRPWLVLTCLWGVAGSGLAVGPGTGRSADAAVVPARQPVPAAETGRMHLRPFNPDDYALAFDVFIANGDLQRAYLLARQAVASVPADEAWRRKLARVAEWTGQRQVAWDNWFHLFEQGGREDEVVDGVLRLAPLAGRSEVAIAAWEARAAQRPLAATEWDDVRYLYETAGRAPQGSRFFEAQFRKEGDARLLEHAAGLAENAGEDERALRLYIERTQRPPFATEPALRAALLLIRRDRVREAYALLQDHSQQVPPETAEFWRLLGNTAWELVETETAERAYQRYVQTPEASAGDWGRLIYLARQHHPAQAAELAFETFRRFGNIEHLLQALSLHGEAGDTQAQGRIFSRLDAQERSRAERDVRFLVLRAQYHQRRAEPDRAWDDFRRALAVSPRDSEVAVPALWFLIDTGRQRELPPLLAALEDTARRDAVYWLPFAAAYHALDRYPEALGWYRQEVRRNPDDALLLLNYAEALQRVQLVGMAGRVRQQAWRLLRERTAATPAEGRQPELLALTQLALLNQPGDASLALVHRVASRLRGVPLAQEDAAQTRDLILSWAVATEQQAGARQWLWLNYARQAGPPGRLPPVSAQGQLALQSGDAPTLQRLLADQAEHLPPQTRYDAALALGDAARAESIAFDTLSRNPVDEDMHDRYRQQVPLRANYLQFRFSKNTFGDLDTHSRQLEARLAVGPDRQLMLGWAENTQASAEPVLASYVPASERLASVGLRWQRAGGETQASLFQRDERDRNIGLRLAQIWSWGRRLQLDGAFGWRADATDSLPLRVAGAEDHLQLGLSYALDQRSFLRLSTRLSNYHTQSGAYLGTGRVHDIEASYRLRTAYPDLRVRLHGTQQGYSYDAEIAERVRELSPDVRAAAAAGRLEPDRYFLTRGSTTWGACLGVGESRAGLSLQEVYSRAFKPFADACATSNSLNGGGYAGVLGIAGSLTGEDHLSLRIEQSSGGSGTGAMTRVLALRYRHYF